MSASSKSERPVLITPGEFARRLGRSPRWGGYVVEQGLVESIPICGTRLRGIPESEVERCKKSMPVVRAG